MGRPHLVALAMLVSTAPLPVASEVVTIRFEGVVGDPSECQTGQAQSLANELAVKGDPVRGQFEYDTAAVVTRTGQGGQRIYDLDAHRLEIKLSIGPPETFTQGEYFAVLHAGLAAGGERPKVAAFEVRREDPSGWPGSPDRVVYGIILDGGDARLAWPSLPNGFDATAFRRARWSVGAQNRKGNLSELLWRLCGQITSLSAPRSDRPSSK